MIKKYRLGEVEFVDAGDGLFKADSSGICSLISEDLLKSMGATPTPDEEEEFEELPEGKDIKFYNLSDAFIILGKLQRNQEKLIKLYKELKERE